MPYYAFILPKMFELQAFYYVCRQTVALCFLKISTIYLAIFYQRVKQINS